MQRTWPPEQGVSDARLAWLAAAPHVRRKTRPWWATAFRMAELSGGGIGTATALAAVPTTASEITGDRARAYAFACDRLADRLQQEERERLRASGELPAWFLPQLDRDAAVWRRRLATGG